MDYVLYFPGDEKRDMNGHKWQQLLQQYLEKVIFNPDQVGQSGFRISCSESVVKEIQHTNPGLRFHLQTALPKINR